ncbi:hypothetical protein [Rhodococcus rhodochrous]|uniref:hypothetical protein n=1 Tax=Rhodococcus rhodochrous TaxID=1829 RepID=UPI001E5FC30A|nr:hypothetical protein [Rhodococcus rhodochrous]MCD2099252.1 hypothetical protein [Rhodococcus rhodochrous]MCD2120569.1 hypothetical protein [Rhodococcus rhodochrous]MCQ4136143.1 hypothetical protein [Rhodococcus rhodochrous]MDJ0017435.1 hypothetical protein [Rhodococcus rhodochrous]
MFDARSERTVGAAARTRNHPCSDTDDLADERGGCYRLAPGNERGGAPAHRGVRNTERRAGYRQ